MIRYWLVFVLKITVMDTTETSPEDLRLGLNLRGHNPQGRNLQEHNLQEDNLQGQRPLVDNHPELKPPEDNLPASLRLPDDLKVVQHVPIPIECYATNVADYFPERMMTAKSLTVQLKVNVNIASLVKLVCITLGKSLRMKWLQFVNAFHLVFFWDRWTSRYALNPHVRHETFLKRLGPVSWLAYVTTICVMPMTIKMTHR